MPRPDWNEFPCIEWPGQINKDGYGLWTQKRAGKVTRIMAHRLAYEALFGPIPEGLVIDHLCRNRACSQPWHLEPVTRGENVRRGIASQVMKERHQNRTECKRGHPLSGDNVRIKKDGKGIDFRECVTCRRLTNRRSKARRRKALVG